MSIVELPGTSVPQLLSTSKKKLLTHAQYVIAKDQLRRVREALARERDAVVEEFKSTPIEPVKRLLEELESAIYQVRLSEKSVEALNRKKPNWLDRLLIKVWSWATADRF